MGISSGVLESSLLGGPPSASSFTGLLDVLGVAAEVAYSTRRLSGGYAGSAIRIRRDNDNAETNIGFSGENLDTAAVASFVGANSAFVVTMFDQSGNGLDVTNAVTTAQPRIVSSGTLDTRNSLAAPKWDGSDDSLGSAAVAHTWGEILALAATTVAAGPWGDFVGIASGDTSSTFCLMANSGGSDYDQAFGIFTTVDVDNTGTANSVFNSVLQQIDGIAATPTSIDLANIGSTRGQAGRFWAGWIPEVVVFAANLSAGNRTAGKSNQKAYWGTP